MIYLENDFETTLPGPCRNRKVEDLGFNLIRGRP